MPNLPDDYSMGWIKCYKHNIKYHRSDGCCDYCLDEWVEKQSNKENPKKTKAEIDQNT